MEDQLRMVRRDLENLPTLQYPDGYYIRTYRKGDEEHWARIMDTAFVDQGRTVQDTYADVINQPDFDPDGFCFVICEGLPIGTACAWKRCSRGEQIGYIDMLAVLPEHTGHKLGKWLTLFLLHYFKAQSMVYVMLDTDDFRLPAIKNYVLPEHTGHKLGKSLTLFLLHYFKAFNLGFVPVYVRENHVLRWRNVFKKLGLL
jgi:mycothiol synthase